MGSDTVFYAASGIRRDSSTAASMRSPHFTTDWNEMLTVKVSLQISIFPEDKHLALNRYPNSNFTHPVRFATASGYYSVGNEPRFEFIVLDCANRRSGPISFCGRDREGTGMAPKSPPRKGVAS
jgi:Domain of unknown function (DUF4113)